jgi:ABC-2 type transport system ATP-binding protein
MGQKKKAFICFALATNTSLLLLDEPSNGLDIPSKTQFRKAIAACMNEEKTIILSTHQINDIDSLLDHIVIIDDAQLILHESVSNICQKLYFTEQEINDSIEDVIYSQSSIRGKQCILPNKSGLDSKLNLELLFNAVLTEKSKIQQIFQP